MPVSVSPPIVNQNLVKSMAPLFVKSYSSSTSWGNALSMARMLPSLRGLWMYSSIDESNRVYDYSEQGRVMSPGAGYPNYDYHGLTPFANFVRADSEYLYRADEPGLSITGALTVMTWVYFDAESTGNNTGLISKWYAVGVEPLPLSYVLYKNTNDEIVFSITTDGATANVVSVDNNRENYDPGNWMFVAGVFTPSTSLNLFVNGTWYSNTTDIPATIYDGDERLAFGRYSRSNYLDGRLSLTVICATDLSDGIIQTFYSKTRALYMGQRSAMGSSSSTSSSTTSSSTSSSTTSSSTSSSTTSSSTSSTTSSSSVPP